MVANKVFSHGTLAAACALRTGAATMLVLALPLFNKAPSHARRIPIPSKDHPTVNPTQTQSSTSRSPLERTALLVMKATELLAFVAILRSSSPQLLE